MDKGREVGIQESIYRSLGLPLTMFSTIVKFINANHPERREGLLKSKAEIESLEEGESVFHNSIHTYYEARPKDAEGDKPYWDVMTLSQFVAQYDIAYKSSQRKNKIKLRNGKGFIVQRGKECVIRYFLRHEHEQEYYRALCVLFLPFRNEMKEIHSVDVKALYFENEKAIEERRSHFEKNRDVMGLLEKAEKDLEDDKDSDSEDEEDKEYEDEETTAKEDVEDYIKSMKAEAQKSLSNHCAGQVRMSDDEFLKKVSLLNAQQRKIFDDFCERVLHNIQDPEPFYIYISGEAGTGKSFLMMLMIEFMNRLPKSSGQELDKPSYLVLAPTGVAAYLIGGVTIESGLGMPINSRRVHKPGTASVNSHLRFLYSDLIIIFIDEISMVGCDKAAMINFTLQSIFGNSEFMGGISVVTTGDFGQLPPVGQSMIWNNSYVDGRIDLSPRHWDENFTICNLTEKMRSQDPEFSRICDKVRLGICDAEVKSYMERHVKACPNEDNLESYAKGKLSIIVPGNAPRKIINSTKMADLLKPYIEKYFESVSVDEATNLKKPPPLDPKLPLTQTGQLETSLLFCKGAPVMVTSNHSVKKYKNNGIVNGVRGFIDSIQPSKDDPKVPEVVWVRFNDDETGQLLRKDKLALTKDHKPNDPLAVPIVRQKKNFQPKGGNANWLREQFPLTICFAITSHKVRPVVYCVFYNFIYYISLYFLEPRSNFG